MLIPQDDQLVETLLAIATFTSDYFLYREFVRHNSSFACYATD